MPKRQVNRPGFKMKVDTTGLDNLSGPSTLNSLAGALYVEAEKIMTDSKENYCPVGLREWGHRPGNLRDSGTVLPPNIKPESVVVTLTYDVNKAPYAYVVHERDPNIGQGKVKYLERPFLAHEPLVARSVAALLQRRLDAIAGGAIVGPPTESSSGV